MNGAEQKLPDLTVVLVRPQGPVNVGLACRAMANMGVTRLRLVQPGAHALDAALGRPFACKATALWQAIEVFNSLPEAVAGHALILATSRRRRRAPMPQLTPVAARTVVQRAAGPVALVMGCEADGLSSDEIAHCDAALCFALPGAYASLNLSHAVLLALYALHPAIEAAVAPGAPEIPLATAAQRQTLVAVWQETLQVTGFFARLEARRFLPRLKALSQNLTLTPSDTHLMCGMLKHFAQASRAADKEG